MKRFKPSLAFAAGLTGSAALLASPAWASGSGMPWEAPLQKVTQSITGPVAQAVAVLAVTVFGLSLAFAEGGSTQRRGIGLLFGLAIAFAASSFALSFLGFAGGAEIR